MVVTCCFLVSAAEGELFLDVVKPNLGFWGQKGGRLSCTIKTSCRLVTLQYITTVFAAKKLPKTEQGTSTVGGGASGQGRRGVDLSEHPQQSGGCCK
ncbi:hypothetical protein HPB52_005195 [Rhipicephalus sanguineus]|uniref:Uncharacterized protein n=1 Tax=Rhipicephalus sanguineus TaxID=34632 RepID=A0A9D4PYI7_RHISA|nr:hypothetical protein HPB52_005195 [Rhipicephalus sanguineus]